MFEIMQKGTTLKQDGSVLELASKQCMTTSYIQFD